MKEEDDSDSSGKAACPARGTVRTLSADADSDVPEPNLREHSTRDHEPTTLILGMTTQ
jgi:hypothetical protein